MYLVRLGNCQDVFQLWHHPTFLHGFRPWLFYGFRRRRKHLFMFSILGFT